MSGNNRSRSENHPHPAGCSAGYNGLTDELASVTIYDGSPEEGASLVCSDEKTAIDSVTQTWQLTSRWQGQLGNVRILKYPVQLTQKIPADATRCEATFERNVRFGDGRHPFRRAICTSTDPHAAPPGLTSVNLNVR